IWRTEVSRLVPPPGSRAPRGSRAMADAWQRHRFFEGVARALLAVDRPTLLVLDNMQWCDQETLEFVTFCLRLATSARLLVAATLRGASPSQDALLGDWAPRTRPPGPLPVVSLGPFAAAATARLAAAISGQPLGSADLALLQATTGGFPLYVI